MIRLGHEELAVRALEQEVRVAAREKPGVGRRPSMIGTKCRLVGSQDPALAHG
jgi:hypothetical protein